MRLRRTVLTSTVLTCALLMGAEGVRAQAPAESTLSIVGSGVSHPTPDLATLSLRVRSGAASATTARSRVNTRLRSILAGIEGLGVPRSSLQTPEITLTRTTRKPLRRGGQGRVFFTASGTVEVRTTMVDRVGPIVDIATKRGADDISGPNFSFTSPTSGKLEATRAAIDDARKRADDAASRLGMRVTGTRSIVIDSDAIAAPEPSVQAESAPSSAGASAPTPVRPGQQTTEISVSIVFVLAAA